MHVLLSIKPNHVENILSGIKIFEFRRRIFTRLDVSTVIIYCTRPIGLLVAEFDIDCILEDSPESLWNQTHSGSGISKEFYDKYFSGRSRAFALKIGEIRIYDKPICPRLYFDGFTPPQSYMYINKPIKRSLEDLQLVLL